MIWDKTNRSEEYENYIGASCLKHCRIYLFKLDYETSLSGFD